MHKGQGRIDLSASLQATCMLSQDPHSRLICSLDCSRRGHSTSMFTFALVPCKMMPNQVKLVVCTNGCVGHATGESTGYYARSGGHRLKVPKLFTCSFYEHVHPLYRSGVPHDFVCTSLHKFVHEMKPIPTLITLFCRLFSPTNVEGSVRSLPEQSKHDCP